jgi:putative phosphoesterase
MKVLIISDTHDHVADLRKVIAKTKDEVEAVVHCGDACAPFMYVHMADFAKPVHVVWGNTNDKEGAEEKCPENVTIHGDSARITFGDKRFFVNHYPDVARNAASEAVYDVICFGHTHVATEEKMGTSLLINPGAVMSETHGGEPKFVEYAIYDTFNGLVSYHKI